MCDKISEPELSWYAVLRNVPTQGSFEDDFTSGKFGLLLTVILDS